MIMALLLDAANILGGLLLAISLLSRLPRVGDGLARFAAGQYTLHHWKLASTSRGLLVISLLLAPLNLLLLASPGADAGVGWLDAGVKGAAVLAFVGIVRAAGRDLIGTHLLPAQTGDGVAAEVCFAIALVDLGCTVKGDGVRFGVAGNGDNVGHVAVPVTGASAIRPWLKVQIS